LANWRSAFGGLPNPRLPFPTLAQAHNLRFPSPFSTHVLSSDVISRTWPTPNILRTTRLVLKRGKMPAWAPQVMLRVSTSWVLEETELDLDGSKGGLELRVRSRNIDHKAVMEVFEWQTFRQREGDKLVYVDRPRSWGSGLAPDTEGRAFLPEPTRLT